MAGSTNDSTNGGGTHTGPQPKTGGITGAGDLSAIGIRELAARLQAHSETLNRDIRRLHGALSEINRAMSVSLERIERLRCHTERLKAAFAPAATPAAVLSTPPSAPAAADEEGAQEVGRPAADHERPAIAFERRVGSDRRSGRDRRAPKDDAGGLLKWIEGTSLDRRSGADRRRAGDRRRPSFDAVASGAIPFVPRGTASTRGIFHPGCIVSLAAYRSAQSRAAAEPTTR